MFAEGVTRDSRESFVAHSLKNHFNEILRGIAKYDGTCYYFIKFFLKLLETWTQIDSDLLSKNLCLSLGHLTQRTHFLKITQTLERYYRTIALHQEIKDNANIYTIKKIVGILLMCIQWEMKPFLIIAKTEFLIQTCAIFIKMRCDRGK